MAETPDRNGGVGSVLVEGRLHPSTLLLGLISVLRRMLIPAGIGIALPLVREDQGSSAGSAIAFAGVLGAIVVVQMAVVWVRYGHYRYRVTTSHLEVQSGVFTRQERRIPLEHIQDLGTKQSLTHRWLGVFTVSVETASSGAEAEAEIDAIGAEQLRELRTALERAPAASAASSRIGPEATAAGTHATASGVDEQAGQGDLLARIPASRLLLRGLTDSRAGLIVLAVGYLVDLASDASGDRFLDWVVSGTTKAAARSASLGPLALVGIVVSGIAAAVLAGAVASAAASLVRFWGFELRLHKSSLRARYGLMTTHVRTVPPQRIQALTLGQSPLRRLLGMGELRAHQVGVGGAQQGQESATGLLLLPLAPASDAERVSARVCQGERLEATLWRRCSPKVVRRYAARGAVLGAAVAAGLFPVVGPGAIAGLAVAVPAVALGALAYRAIGYELTERSVRVRSGHVGRKTVLVPLASVQGVELRQVPLERWTGLARVTMYLAGGTEVTVPHLPVATARALCRRIGTAAAEHSFLV
jgi:putative membrane protein